VLDFTFKSGDRHIWMTQHVFCDYNFAIIMIFAVLELYDSIVALTVG